MAVTVKKANRRRGSPMIKILFIGLYVLMIFSFNNAAAADITISGSSQFDCSLLAKYMKKHGYFYIGPTITEYALDVNTFAAKNAEVIIEDEQGTVLEIGITDKKGDFYITVPEKDVYKVIIRFQGKDTEKIVKFPNIEDITINVGYFNSEVVGGWIQTASLSY